MSPEGKSCPAASWLTCAVPYSNLVHTYTNWWGAIKHHLSGCVKPVGSTFRGIMHVGGIAGLPLNDSSGTYWTHAFRSMHPGGGQFGLADGSIRFIDDNIDLQTYKNLTTVGGGETIGAW